LKDFVFSFKRVSYLDLMVRQYCLVDGVPVPNYPRALPPPPAGVESPFTSRWQFMRFGTLGFFLPRPFVWTVFFFLFFLSQERLSLGRAKNGSIYRGGTLSSRINASKLSVSLLNFFLSFRVKTPGRGRFLNNFAGDLRFLPPPLLSGGEILVPFLGSSIRSYTGGSVPPLSTGRLLLWQAGY